MANLNKIAEIVAGRLQGDPGREITGVQALKRANPDQIAFIARGKEDAPKDPIEPPKVKAISGAPAEIKSVKYTGKYIAIDEKHAGPGESEIEIDKRNIPEARNWIERTHAIQAGINYDWFAGRFHASGDALYFHRWGRLSLGGGATIGDGIYGVKAAAQWWF